ncbi:MAG: nickel pincer cofactor biosynthesis protein LarC, partial [Eubacteriales bacterium]|nr:nickel pincer cofactor biosynthesis protein LarC [Eubacteriales bacterium]
LAVFREIGIAEAHVHGVELDAVHFHEVGAIDSIVDIVGGAIALDYLGVDYVVVSPISDGTGTISCQHGVMPVPVPAVVKMLENSSIPYITGTSHTELVTPTGLGLAKTFANRFGALPAMTITQIGYGFGQREIGRLNALRVFLGEEQVQSTKQPFNSSEMDQVVMLSCHIDNTSAEALGYLMTKLLDIGAADVAYSPILMKKNRPGQLLTIISPIQLERNLVELVFSHCGTIGIRREIVDRHVMQRFTTIIQLPDCSIRLKTVQWQSINKTYPEYEDLVVLANMRSINLDQARQIVDSARNVLAEPTE